VPNRTPTAAIPSSPASWLCSRPPGENLAATVPTPAPAAARQGNWCRKPMAPASRLEGPKAWHSLGHAITGLTASDQINIFANPPQWTGWTKLYLCVAVTPYHTCSLDNSAHSLRTEGWPFESLRHYMEFTSAWPAQPPIIGGAFGKCLFLFAAFSQLRLTCRREYSQPQRVGSWGNLLSTECPSMIGIAGSYSWWMCETA
jgi:hypothetical protein